MTIMIHSLYLRIKSTLLNTFSLWLLIYWHRHWKWWESWLSLLWEVDDQLTVILFKELSVWLFEERLDEKDFWIDQLINSDTDSFKMNWKKDVVNVSCELVCSSSLFVILADEVKLFNEMTVKRCIFFIDQSIVSVDSYSLIVVRDWEAKNLSMKFLLTRHCFV